MLFCFRLFPWNIFVSFPFFSSPLLKTYGLAPHHGFLVGSLDETRKTHGSSMACIHMCVYSCLSLWHVVNSVFQWLASFSIISRNLSTRDDPLDLLLQVSFAFFPPFASILPSHMLVAHIIFPFHQPKKKNSLGFSSDFSLLLDEVPAIYIFVCRKKGGTYK